MRTIPNSIAQKIQNTLQTRANNSDPKLYATLTNNVMESIDTTTKSALSYWDTELIAPQGTITNMYVAPKRLKYYGPPEAYYQARVESGQIKLYIKKNPDLLNEGWVLQSFTIGTALDVELVFDGNWQEYNSKWNFYTEEHPWIYWIDLNHNIYAQHWADANSKHLISTAGSTLGWNDYTYTNILPEGSFASSTGSWTVSGAAKSVSNNWLKIDGSGAATTMYTYRAMNVAAVSGHKYFVRGLVKYKNVSPTSAFVALYNGTTKVGGDAGYIANPELNRMFTVSNVITFNSSAEAANFRYRFSATYASTADEGNANIYLMKPLVIDLTAKYGAGNEPTAAQMEDLFAGNRAAGILATGSPEFVNLSNITNGTTTGDAAQDWEGVGGGGGGFHYVQIDLGKAYHLEALRFYRMVARSYWDTIALISNDPTFATYTVVYNTDDNGNMGFGVGTDVRAAETAQGITMFIQPQSARYIRVYSNGSEVDTTNTIHELMVLGGEIPGNWFDGTYTSDRTPPQRIHALRAWRSQETLSFDAGLAFAYTKWDTGTLHWVARRQLDDGSYIWTNDSGQGGEGTVPLANAEKVRQFMIFNTSDGRVGFMVNDMGGTTTRYVTQVYRE